MGCKHLISTFPPLELICPVTGFQRDGSLVVLGEHSQAQLERHAQQLCGRDPAELLKLIVLITSGSYDRASVLSLGTELAIFIIDWKYSASYKIKWECKHLRSEFIGDKSVTCYLTVCYNKKNLIYRVHRERNQGRLIISMNNTHQNVFKMQATQKLKIYLFQEKTLFFTSLLKAHCSQNAIPKLPWLNFMISSKFRHDTAY